MNNSFKKFIIGLIVFSLLICLSYPVSADLDGVNDGEYWYAYGDSITAGKEILGCNSGEQHSRTYICRMVERHYPSYWNHNVDHKDGDGNGDCSGRHEDDSNRGGTVEWSNAGGFDADNDYFIIMFGNNDFSRYYNDGWTSCSALNLASNMVKMCNWTRENNTIPVLCAMPCYQNLDDAYHHDDPANYMPYVNDTMGYWKDWSVRFVPTWDALDENPYNGVLEPNNYSYYNCSTSRSHLNYEGHEAIGDIIHYFIEGMDYDTTYYSTNATMILTADYNETVYINNSNYNWNTSVLEITCLTNSSVMPFTVQTAFNGSEMIRFNIQKDSTYRLRDIEVGNFVSINNQSNNSYVSTVISHFNWTATLNTSYYELQIANDSSFTDIWLNLSGINGSFGVNFTLAGDFVEFILPNEYRREWYQDYYFRFRAVVFDERSV